MTETWRIPLTTWWEPSTHVVYRAFAENDDLLYVGVTRDPGQRFYLHEYNTHWWHHVHRVELSQEFLDRQDAEDAEAMTIAKFEPLMNRHYPHVPERASSLELQWSAYEYTPEPNYPAVMRRIGAVL